MDRVYARCPQRGRQVKGFIRDSPRDQTRKSADILRQSRRLYCCEPLKAAGKAEKRRPPKMRTLPDSCRQSHLPDAQGCPRAGRVKAGVPRSGPWSAAALLPLLWLKRKQSLRTSKARRLHCGIPSTGGRHWLRRLPDLSNFCCHPGRAVGSSYGLGRLSPGLSTAEADPGKALL